MLNSSAIAGVALLAGLVAALLSSLHSDLLHLPDQSGEISFRLREEILTLPLMDSRKLPLRFSYAAVLVSVDIRNEDEHAVALCSELTGRLQSSRLKKYHRLLPCGNDKNKQIQFNHVEENPHVWSSANILETTSVHFLRKDQLLKIPIVILTVENHNAVLPAALSYEISVSVVGPRNPLYWFHWFIQANPVHDYLEKLTWQLMKLTKMQTENMMHYLNSMRKNMPTISKMSKLVNKYINPQSCRAVEFPSNVMRDKCFNFRKRQNEPFDIVLSNFLPRTELCNSLFGGNAIVGFLVVLNIVCFFFFSTSNVSTTIFHMYSIKRMFFSMFAHFDWIHLLLNMQFLLVTGSKLSNLLDCNHVMFLWFYLISGLGGGVLSLLWRRLWGSYHYCAGASGALYGISVVSTVLMLNERSIDVYNFDLFHSFAMKFGMDMVRSAMFGWDKIDTASHVGGALTGFFLVTTYIDNSFFF